MTLLKTMKILIFLMIIPASPYCKGLQALGPLFDSNVSVILLRHLYHLKLEKISDTEWLMKSEADTFDCLLDNELQCQLPSELCIRGMREVLNYICICGDIAGVLRIFPDLTHISCDTEYHDRKMFYRKTFTAEAVVLVFWLFWRQFH